jgi:hypothetical protein
MARIREPLDWDDHAMDMDRLEQREYRKRGK